MSVEGVRRRVKSLSAGAGMALVILLLALILALTVAAAMAPTRPFDEPVSLAFLPMVRGVGDDRIWDPRLDDLGVTLEPAVVTPGEPYWKLVEARWADPEQAGGDHTIYIDVLDSNGERAMGQEVNVGWPGGSITVTIHKAPGEPWGVDFPMYNTLGSYDVLVQDLPSDRIYGLGLGTAENPDVPFHTNFYLIFRMTEEQEQ